MIKAAKIKISHSKLKERLGLPEDVEITSVYTEREFGQQRENWAYIYMRCDRFKETSLSETIEEINMEDVEEYGQWDAKDNE